VTQKNRTTRVEKKRSDPAEASSARERATTLTQKVEQVKKDDPEARKDFAEHFQLGPKRRVVLAIDQAGFHPSDKVEVPDGIHIIEMPPKSPELQPAERLWPLADEPLANRTFSSLDELEEVIFHRCQTLLERPDWIRGYAKYYWWPDDAN